MDLYSKNIFWRLKIANPVLSFVDTKMNKQLSFLGDFKFKRKDKINMKIGFVTKSEHSGNTGKEKNMPVLGVSEDLGSMSWVLRIRRNLPGR